MELSPPRPHLSAADTLVRGKPAEVWQKAPSYLRGPPGFVETCALRKVANGWKCSYKFPESLVNFQGNLRRHFLKKNIPNCNMCPWKFLRVIYIAFKHQYDGHKQSSMQNTGGEGGSSIELWHIRSLLVAQIWSCIKKGGGAKKLNVMTDLVILSTCRKWKMAKYFRIILTKATT